MNISLSGLDHWRAALACCVLSGKSVAFERISPKVTDAEVAYANLIALLAPGSKVEVQGDGKRVTFVPGQLEGGKIQVELPAERTIGYYLEYVLLVLPFMKLNCELTCTGATNSAVDLSADYLCGLARHLNYFLGDETQLQVDVQQRAFSADGSATGRVVVRSKPAQELKALQYTKPSHFKALEGIVMTLNVPPARGQELLKQVRQRLSFVPNVSLQFSSKGGKNLVSGPGFGCLLRAETEAGGFVAQELYSSEEMGVDPVRLADALVELLVGELTGCGAPDSLCQPLIAMACCLSEANVSWVRFGKLNERTVGVLRLCQLFFGVEAQLEEYKVEGITGGIWLTVRGAGVKNVALRGW